MLRTGARLNRDDGLTADPLHIAPAQPLIGVLLDAWEVGRNHLKFQTGTARIEHENIHKVSPIFTNPAQPRRSKMQPIAGSVGSFRGGSDQLVAKCHARWPLPRARQDPVALRAQLFRLPFHATGELRIQRAIVFDTRQYGVILVLPLLASS